MEESGGSLNRLMHIANEPAYDISISMAHDGALEQMALASAELPKSDFVVVDVILMRHVISSLSNILLTSTIWFDHTNGKAFATHYNDGLAFGIFKRLAQEFAAAISPLPGKMRVSRYYALAMNLYQGPQSSPVVGTSIGEVAVVLWLGSGGSSNSSSGSIDGLQIFEVESAIELTSQGVTTFPLVHSDFLSKNRNLSINLDERLPMAAFETVKRMVNRVVIIGPKRPFVFVTPNAEDLANTGSNSFEASTMLAFVVILAYT